MGVVLQDIRCDDDHQFLIAPVLRSLDQGVYISHKEDLCLLQTARQGLLFPVYCWLIFGMYICTNNIPYIPPDHNSKTRHIMAMVHCPFYLSPLLPLPHNGDTAPISALRIY